MININLLDLIFHTFILNEACLATDADKYDGSFKILKICNFL